MSSGADRRVSMNSRHASDAMAAGRGKSKRRGNDPACVKYVRADWDAGKRGWLEARKSFPPGSATTFDADLARLRACGDAAGVTMWLEL